MKKIRMIIVGICITIFLSTGLTCFAQTDGRQIFNYYASLVDVNKVLDDPRVLSEIQDQLAWHDIEGKYLDYEPLMGQSHSLDFKKEKIVLSDVQCCYRWSSEKVKGLLSAPDKIQFLKDNKDKILYTYSAQCSYNGHKFVQHWYDWCKSEYGKIPQVDERCTVIAWHPNVPNKGATVSYITYTFPEMFDYDALTEYLKSNGLADYTPYMPVNVWLCDREINFAAAQKDGKDYLIYLSRELQPGFSVWGEGMYSTEYNELVKGLEKNPVATADILDTIDKCQKEVDDRRTEKAREYYEKTGGKIYYGGDVTDEVLDSIDGSGTTEATAAPVSAQENTSVQEAAQTNDSVTPKAVVNRTPGIIEEEQSSPAGYIVGGIALALVLAGGTVCLVLWLRKKKNQSVM